MIRVESIQDSIKKLFICLIDLKRLSIILSVSSITYQWLLLPISEFYYLSVDSITIQWIVWNDSMKWGNSPRGKRRQIEIDLSKAICNILLIQDVYNLTVEQIYENRLPKGATKTDSSHLKVALTEGDCFLIRKRALIVQKADHAIKWIRYGLKIASKYKVQDQLLILSRSWHMRCAWRVT